MSHSYVSRRDFLATGSASVAGLVWPSAHAQSVWPNKPLRLVVPFATGGSSEIVARAIAGELGKTLGKVFSWRTSPEQQATLRCKKWPTVQMSTRLFWGI